MHRTDDVAIAAGGADTLVAAALAVTDVAAGAGSMTHKARGECWVQQVSRVSTMVVQAQHFFPCLGS